MADQETPAEAPAVEQEQQQEGEAPADAPAEAPAQEETTEQPPAENPEPDTTTEPTDEQKEDKPTEAEPEGQTDTQEQDKAADEEPQQTEEAAKEDAEAPQEEAAAASEDVKTGEEGDKEQTVEAAEGEQETKETEEGEASQEAEKKEEEEGQEAENKEEGDEAEAKEDGEKTSESPVPQSNTFAEGERPESPIGVGEKLSREGTPTQDDVKIHPDVLEPGTPDRSRPASETGDEHALEVFPEEREEISEAEEEEEEEEPGFDREALLEKKQAALAEKERYLAQNAQLQHKLAEYFRRKKADENRQEYDKNTNDQDSKYVKFMAQLDELHRQDENLRYEYDQQIKLLEDKCQQKKQDVDEEYTRFMEFKKKVALNSMSNRSGKPIPPKDIDQYLSNEKRKETEVVNVRLENIKLKNKLKKKEQQLKSKEELAENLHLIDFEQLKIENQTYNEKIEERNEELLKLRKKITSTVQVLTHLKEKLQFVQAENQVQSTKLREVEAEVALKRDVLSRTKQARDALRIDNQRLRQSCGLLGNEPLLRDFEERRDEGEDLSQKLENLKMQHAELTLNCNQVRRKIEQARATHG